MTQHPIAMTSSLHVQGPYLIAPHSSRRVELYPRTLIGRGPHNDLQLHDLTVSSKHALLAWSPSGWTLRDLGSRNGTWLDEIRVQAGQQVSLVCGASLRFGCQTHPWILRDDSAPRSQCREAPTAAPADPLPSLHSVQVQFQVSADEETVAWRVIGDTLELELGARAHVYLLLTLARIRIAEAHLPPAERGWTYADELAQKLGIRSDTLKVQVYRARRQLFGKLLDGASIIERRTATNQIRFGADHIVLSAL